LVNIKSPVKLTLLLSIPIIVIIVLIGAASFVMFQNRILQPHMNDLDIIAEDVLKKIEEPLYLGDSEKIIEVFSKQNNTLRLRSVFIALNNGRTIKPNPENRLYAPIINDSFTKDALRSADRIIRIKEDALQFSHPLVVDIPIGILRLDYDISDVQQTINQVRNYVVFLIILASVSVLVLIYYFSLSISYPFNQLQEMADQVAAGNYHVKLKKVSNDETGEIINSFMSMAEEIGNYRDELAETEEHKRKEVEEAINRATSDLRLEAAGQERLTESLRMILKQLRKTNKELELSRRDLKKKQEELEKSNLELKAAQKKLQNFNEKLEVGIKERTKELEEANVRITKLLEMKVQFVNQVSHDLRTPLMPILTLLPLIKEEINKMPSKNKDELMHMIETVTNNATYLSNIVTNTLSISRLDTGKSQLKFEPYNIYDIVNEAVNNDEVMFSKGEINIINNTPKNLPKVYVDKLRIIEVLQNLISNADKFMEKDKKLVFDATADSKFVTVSVKDNGIGIAPEHITKIFEEFFKADPSRHSHSSGLGLSICKRIIEKHGGKIWAESEGIGKGSTFKFTLPIYKEQKIG